MAARYRILIEQPDQHVVCQCGVVFYPLDYKVTLWHLRFLVALSELKSAISSEPKNRCSVVTLIRDGDCVVGQLADLQMSTVTSKRRH